ncbi:Multihaem cytochrome [Acididesulfobacillus acetoxydans]|uniref:Cytochrome c protein n=1 Tax=Acididesulfobacillus acetoxydans TaxID=1561005 RepID=A0A8S0Y1W4_9FIRM|nr:sulfate reduction electron transfer complex DsrMKJOP subunit DsrJ [Acididesulfobacillus acetoxydans]CAA7600025.1 Multihaem cytochrome [Acididesulfobacillus acetoxydans]CEJ07800.1 Cytochrome c protein [Acididesulfobacillus acetoxydans]
MIYGGKKIFAGLFIFVVLLISPFLANIGKADAQPNPSLNTPAINALATKQCVGSQQFMRTYHMQLLNQWRDQALRHGEYTYVNSQGQKFTISLENTCLKCHSNEQQFCNTCHTYVGVTPYCWECHQKGATQ